MDLIQMLNDLADYQDQLEALRLRYDDERRRICQPVADQLAALDAEVKPLLGAAQQNIDAIDAQIREVVLQVGEGARGARLLATYQAGRPKWDARKLAGYAAAHPEINQFVTAGEPVVTIRRVR